jgi:phosphatidylserine/phosphatidylglycerophosphate/cardiolipin synthase-like enzyme
LIKHLGTFDGSPEVHSIQSATADLFNRDAAWILSDAFANSSVTWSEITAAMAAVDFFVRDNVALTEIIWTGPANNSFPVRRLDQVLYDLVARAQKRIVLVTFAAHRVPLLCDYLKRAVRRGVELTLIIESEEESEGQLTRDAAVAFRDVPTGRIYYWPVSHRQRNQAGRPGKLHMKCAIVDDVALIGSANLTDDAFNRNMELGILVRERTTVDSISRHFQELIQAKILLPL